MNMIWPILLAPILCSELLFQHQTMELGSPRAQSLERFLLRTTIDHLRTTIKSAQANTSTDYFPRKTYPPIVSWARQEGIYDSFVHLNFHGDLPLSAALRNLYNFPDDNAFVTIFVVHALVEAMELDLNVHVGHEELRKAIAAIGTHTDRNKAPVPVYSFWNQVELDIDGKRVYKASPPNIDLPLQDLDDGLNLLKTFTDALNLKNISKFLDTAITVENAFRAAFRIPPDADDTGTNLALGMQLVASGNKDIQQIGKLWSSLNGDNFDAVLEYLLKYSYRPFSSHPIDSTIDTRTYVWIRGFLAEEADRRGVAMSELKDEDFAILTTWIQSTDELKTQYSYSRMPFNINNVDASVVANALYGITNLYATSSKLKSVMPFAKVKTLYQTNIRLLVWILKERIVEKFNSFALLYYPPKFAFYWFVSRIVHILESENHLTKATDPEFIETAKESAKLLGDAMRSYGVDEMLKEVQCNVVLNVCYWDDFLGNADKFNNQTRPLSEDRVFSTAIALNALIDAFSKRTVGDKTKLEWLSMNPKVFQTIQGAVNWLVTAAHVYPKENAFFSASVKHQESTPFAYPSNHGTYVNGTEINCHKMSGVAFDDANILVVSMKGVVSQEEYEQMLQGEGCFGKKVPLERIGQGLNCDDCTFPYWSSPALTDSMRLLALTKYWNLREYD